MVKEGYKETEIGIIPTDWKVNKLGDLGEFKNGINKDKEKFGYGVPIIGLMDVFGVNYIASTVNSGLVDASMYEQKDYSIRKGDVLFVRSSVKPEGVGQTAVAVNDLDNSVFSGFLIRYRTNELTTNFKRYAFHTSYFRENIIAASTVSANTNINQDNLKQLLIAYPENNKEQDIIAEALSDMDNLISSLEKLIVKKKAIKQGAMQELLTGGKQLYSNANELEEIPIKDLFSYINGKSLEEFFNYNSGYKVISIGNYSSEGTFIDTNTYIDHSYKAQFHNLIASNNDLVMILNDKTSIGTILGRVLLIDKDDSYIINQRSVILRLKNDKFCAKYFYYLLNSKYVRKNIMKKSKPGTQIYLNLPDVLELSVKYTSDIKEQQIIANTLSDIDAEIAALEQKLTKCQKLKQGMMQQLLTGKIRLI